MQLDAISIHFYACITGMFSKDANFSPGSYRACHIDDTNFFFFTNSFIDKFHEYFQSFNFILNLKKENHLKVNRQDFNGCKGFTENWSKKVQKGSKGIVVFNISNLIYFFLMIDSLVVFSQNCQ